MRFTKMTALVLTGAIGMAPLAGCESLPGSEKEQGAVIGGVGGAVAGAALGGEDNRLLTFSARRGGVREAVGVDLGLVQHRASDGPVGVVGGVVHGLPRVVGTGKGVGAEGEKHLGIAPG